MVNWNYSYAIKTKQTRKNATVNYTANTMLLLYFCCFPKYTFSYEKKTGTTIIKTVSEFDVKNRFDLFQRHCVNSSLIEHGSDSSCLSLVKYYMAKFDGKANRIWQLYQLHPTYRVYSLLSNTIVLLANAIKIIRFTEPIHSVYTIIVFVCLAACLWHNEVLCSIFYTPLHIVTFAFIITYQVSAHIATRSRKWSEPTHNARVAYTIAVNAITRLFESHICTYKFHCFLEPPGFLWIVISRALFSIITPNVAHKQSLSFIFGGINQAVIRK